MTQEEYIMNRLLLLEEENRQLKLENEELKHSKEVRFVLIDQEYTCSYSVNIKNGKMEVVRNE